MASVKPPKITVSSMKEAESALAHAKFLIHKSEGLLAQMGKIKAEKEFVDKQIAAIDEELEKWARKDRTNWTGKTLNLATGSISFETSPGKVVLVKSVAKTWEAAVALLAKKKLQFFSQFLRPQPPKLDKELVAAEFKDGRITNEELAVVGLKVEKPELCVIVVKR